MRMSGLMILAAGLFGGFFSWAGPAQAQTFDPNYPVCMQISDWGGSRVDCSFTSMAQCNATASGLPATCMLNPYFGSGRRDRRY